MNYKETFAQRLIDLREQKNITQQELADELGITRQSLSLYEKAERTINIELLAKIADFFNVSTDYLMGRTDTATLDENIQTACKVTGLSEDAIAHLNFFGTSEKQLFNKLIQSKYFRNALDALKKYYCLYRAIENKPKNLTIDFEKILNPSEEERALTNAEIFLEENGYIVLTSDYEKLDFYQQRFTSIMKEAIEDINRR